MALFVIEGSYAEVLELEAEGAAAIEADDEDAIREAARRAHLPADVIVRVDEIDPDKVLAGALTSTRVEPCRQQVVSSGGTSRSTR